ncbi:MAG: diguanylate cyclase [Calditerrivibrio sp.]|nr:diguanylate cyclase [Calditerrivibrio sp.]
MKEELKEVFEKYLDCYLTKRDIYTTINLLGPNFTVYGTGFDEKGKDRITSIDLYIRDLTQVKEPIKYTIDELTIVTPTDNIGIILCDINFEFYLLNTTVKFNHIRISSIWVKHQDRWLMEHKHISFPTKEHGEDEAYPLKELEDRNIVLERCLAERTIQLNDTIKELTITATTDKLTGLFNRRKIEDILEIEIERSKRYNTIFSVILTDIDYFKKVNDEFGHVAGDNTLIQFSEILSSRLRKTDFCGRWGGEEFIIVCPETSCKDAVILAEDIRKSIEKKVFKGIGHKTASFGVTEYKIGETHDSLINRVDKLLYKAKLNGRNRVETDPI